MSEQEKTPEELAEEERQAAIARGDILDEEETLEASEESVGEDDGAEEPEVEDDEEDVIEAEAEDSGDDDDGVDVRTESDGEEDGDREKPPIMIPKSRFDEAQQKARQKQQDLEERLAKYESQERQASEAENVKELKSELEELRDKYENFVFEGESAKAREIRKEIERKEEDIFAARLAQTNQQTQRAAIEQMRYDAQLAQVEAKYSELNPDSPEFNEAKAEEVADMMAAFQNTGYTATAALQKAIHYVMPPPSAAVEPTEDVSGVVREKRTVQARKKTAKAVKSAPPSLGEVGRNSDQAGASDDGLPDPMKLSEKQFERLSEEQKAKLRGDSYA